MSTHCMVQQKEKTCGSIEMIELIRLNNRVQKLKVLQRFCLETVLICIKFIFQVKVGIQLLVFSPNMFYGTYDNQNYQKRSLILNGSCNMYLSLVSYTCIQWNLNSAPHRSSYYWRRKDHLSQSSLASRNFVDLNKASINLKYPFYHLK